MFVEREDGELTIFSTSEMMLVVKGQITMSCSRRTATPPNVLKERITSISTVVMFMMQSGYMPSHFTGLLVINLVTLTLRTGIQRGQ